MPLIQNLANLWSRSLSEPELSYFGYILNNYWCWYVVLSFELHTWDISILLIIASLYLVLKCGSCNAQIPALAASTAVHEHYQIDLSPGINRKLMLRCLLVHTRKEQSSDSLYLLKVCFFLPQHSDTEEQQNFLSEMLSLLLCECSIHLAERQRIFDRSFGRQYFFYPCVHHLYHADKTVCKWVLAALSLATVPLKRDLPQPTLKLSMSNRCSLLI